MKLTRSKDRTRFCDLCCHSIPETEFPGKDWVCADCKAKGRTWLMPLIKVGDSYARYDTRKVFAGYRVFKVYQGDTREQFETEVRSPLGEFYAMGGACVALWTKTARAATTLLKAYPELRVLVSGDDGRTVLLMPAELFPKVAKHAKALRGRKTDRPLNEKQRASIEKARAARSMAAAQPALL